MSVPLVVRVARSESYDPIQNFVLIPLLVREISSLLEIGGGDESDNSTVFCIRFASSEGKGRFVRIMEAAAMWSNKHQFWARESPHKEFSQEEESSPLNTSDEKWVSLSSALTTAPNVSLLWLPNRH